MVQACRIASSRFTDETAKMNIGHSPAKRNAIKSIRRTKHYSPYASLQEPLSLQPFRITLTQAL